MKSGKDNCECKKLVRMKEIDNKLFEIYQWIWNVPIKYNIEFIYLSMKIPIYLTYAFYENAIYLPLNVHLDHYSTFYHNSKIYLIRFYHLT